MWKYINPGDYRFLHNHNGTSYTNISDQTKFDKTGMGYTTQAQEDYPVKLPNNTTDIWFKADVYVDDDATIIFHSRTTVYGVVVRFSKTGWRLAIGHRGYSMEDQRFGPMNEIRAESMDLEKKTTSVILHIKGAAMDESSIFNVADGEVELRLNNRIVAKVDKLAVLNGESIQLQTINSSSGASYFSNMIVSTEKLVLRENVFMLPVANTTATGWTETTNGGVTTYTTDDVGKSIVQTVDAEALRTALGENISITSVVMQAFDLSSNDEDVVDSIQKIIKTGGQEYIVGSTLLMSSNYITDSIAKNPATNEAWTLEDLASIELILRTAKSSA